MATFILGTDYYEQESLKVWLIQINEKIGIILFVSIFCTVAVVLRLYTAFVIFFTFVIFF